MARLLATLALGLCATGASAASFDPAAFDPPSLDGVSSGPRGDAPGDLSPYLFAGGHDWPAIRLHAKRPLDWSGAGALAVAVENPAAAPFDVLLRLDDRPDADGDDRSLTGIATIPAHARVTLVLPLGATPSGMRGRPPSGLVPRAGDRVMPDVRGTVDLRHIVAVHISGVRHASSRTLLIGPPTLRDTEGSRGTSGAVLADAFGQAIAGEWPEKVHGESDLRRKLAAADTQTQSLAAAAAPTADRWGGMVGAPRQATGFFRTAKAGERWMLVTPEGHAFFSLGVDAVQSTNPTVIAGRETLFADLPRPGSPLSGYYGQDQERRTFDIGRADLARGLGEAWQSRWPRQTTQRLKAWGFNTLGNWSEETLGPSLPHVTFTDVEGASAMVPMGDRALVDPFDPGFLAVADSVAQAMTTGRQRDPGLIGYFSGNELPWGDADRPAEGIAAHVLRLGPASPARRALIADLRARYATVDGLAAAWTMPAPHDWDDAISVPASPSAVARADIARFEAHFADRYFSVVAAALKRYDPNHLYLGTRFAAATPSVVQACAHWCDVLSFNVYGDTPEATSALWRGLDKPVLIGEFHFGSLDRGSFWPGMTAVGSEGDRGPAYAAYLRAAVADPAIVGAHWYQYADEPLTGRPYDGENGHIGLVAVTDIPYAGFVAAVAAANRHAIETFGRAVAAPH